MRFVLHMAWRDSKASRRRLLAFSACIVFGIAALVALDSFSVSMKRAIRDDSKALLGADIVLTSHAPFARPVLAEVRRLGGEVAEETVFPSMMVFPPPGRRTRLVQVRAETGDFPFYGGLVTTPVAAAARLRAAQQTGEPIVLLDATLFAEFHLRIGEQVRIGRGEFRVAGAVRKAAGQSLVVTQLEPRALIAAAALPKTGFIADGPLVRRRLAIELPPGSDAGTIAARLRDRFAADHLSIETVAGRRRELGRAFANVDGFLNLAGFIALLLGAIGVASAVHMHVRRKVPTVAILRCLGASGRQAFGVYLVQGCAIGVAGAIGGAALGIGLQAAAPALARGLVPFAFSFAISGWAIARGMGAGILICLLFTLLPLLGVRRVSPLAALRASVGGPDGADPALFWLGAAIVAAVAAFALWQTRSLPIGLGFTGVLGLGLLAFAAAARLLAAAARRWTPPGLPWAVRQGVANLHRPRNRTVLLLVALGLGTFLFLTLFLTRTAFLRELRFIGAGNRPNLMFFDIQDGQVAPLDRFLAEHGAPVREQAPLVAMKIAAVNGRPVEGLLRDPDSRAAAWALRREYRSTYRDHLIDTERVIAGTFTGRVTPGTSPFPISVDEGLARDLRLSIGERVDWDVQGVILHSEVGSIRRVDWRRLEPNFFVVFPAGVLENAPKFYAAAVRTSGPAASGELQGAVARAFPSVTAIDLAAILETLDGVFRKVALVVEFMALFTAATAV
ncbi:MAG: ABC transporter permease, partial [Opitutaceae bacterium]